MTDDEIDRSPNTVRTVTLPEGAKYRVEPWPPVRHSAIPIPAHTIAHRDFNPVTQRPTIERYLMVTVQIPGGTITAGLHRSLGEPLHFLRNGLRDVIEVEALALNGDDVTDESAGRLIDSIEYQLNSTWPARAWFCEVWDGDSELAQSYAPYGRPRT